MALNPLRIRRSFINLGATEDQADEATEALAEGFAGLVTTEDLQAALGALEHRIVNRLLLAMIGLSAVIIGAVALIVHL